MSDPSGIDTVHTHDNNDPLSKHYTHKDDAPQHAVNIHGSRDKNRHGWRRVVVNLTPAWFSASMGTGISSILLQRLPYNGRWLYWISVVLFALNMVIFVLLTFLSVVRYTMFKGIFWSMLDHPVQSLFLGTIPMGLATLINMMVFVCVPAWGTWMANFAWGFWWADVVLALASCLLLPWIVIYQHPAKLSSMTAAWLLPVVATIVAAATGGIVANVLPNDQHALWTIIISYILWGVGLPFAMMILVIYFQRLTMYSLPPREVIVSVFLPLGPIGQGAFGIMTLGRDALNVFKTTQTIPQEPGVAGALGGEVFYANGLYIGLILWGFGVVWLFFAIAAITRHKFPFSLGWWSFTFPLGVYATATTQIAVELPSRFFRVLGTIFSLVVVALWAVVFIETIKKAWTGEIFAAPEAVSEKTTSDEGVTGA